MVEMMVQQGLSGESQWMLGMWLRDCISGIGTLTFCDPDTGIYGALGHSVNDEESGVILPLGERRRYQQRLHYFHHQRQQADGVRGGD